MNPAHLHLVLNHVPVVGAGLAFALFLYGAGRRSDDLKKAALLGFVVVGLLAIPAYLTGEPAEKIVENHPGIAASAVEQHEEAAEISLAAAIVVGLLAAALLVSFRSRPLPTRLLLPALVVALALSGMMAWTANLGGRIHHTEIGGTVATGAESERD